MWTDKWEQGGYKTTMCLKSHIQKSPIYNLLVVTGMTDVAFQPFEFPFQGHFSIEGNNHALILKK